MRFSLLQPLSQVPIAVVDTETTGASVAFGHRVVEVGIARIENGQVVARYEQLIDPGRPISPGVTALTGISNAMVAGQPRFREQLPAMMRVLEGAALMGHNVSFDLSFLHAEFRKAGVELAGAVGDVPVFDTVRIARKRFGRGGNALPLLSRRLGVPPVVSHRALADALTTAAVFEKLLEPAGGYRLCLCDALAQQGGPVPLSSGAGQGQGQGQLLPLELEEALDAGRTVVMVYVDAGGRRTERLVRPLHVRRLNGELTLVAHCHLRDACRTFKLDRIVELRRHEPEAVVLLKPRASIEHDALSHPERSEGSPCPAEETLRRAQGDDAAAPPAMPMAMPSGAPATDSPSEPSPHG